MDGRRKAIAVPSLKRLDLKISETYLLHYFHCHIVQMKKK